MRNMWYVTVLLVLTALLCAGIAVAETPETPMIELSMEGYELAYENLSETVLTHEVPEDTPENDLVFSVLLREADQWTVPVFTMMLDEEDGDYAAVLTDETGHILPVTFLLAEKPQNMNAAEEEAFAAAQEQMHLILTTLILKAVPIRADEKAGSLELQSKECVLSYDAALAERLFARENEDGSLEFYTKLAGREYTVFTVLFRSDAGDIVMMYDDAQGGRIPVAFRMATPPQDLPEDELYAFFVAQEAVSQVMTTLTLR